MKKNISLMLWIIVILSIFIGCSEKQNDEVTIKLFNMDKANKIVAGYLDSLIAGDINKANEYLSPQLLEGNKILGEGVSEIISYKPDCAVEGGTYGYFVYSVVRSSGIQSKSDLEDMTFKINKIDGEYKIEEVKAKSKKEVYASGGGLRIIGEEGGKSSLIVSLDSLPKDTYLKDNKVMIYKDKIPNNGFGKVSLSFTGTRIAVTTTDNIDSYIFLAYIDETLMASATIDSDFSQSQGESGINQLENILEKPIAQKIVSVDLLKESKVIKLDFSEKEETLQIDYKNKYNMDRIKLYSTGDGSMIPTELDAMFSEENYNIYDGVFGEDNFTFKVSSLNDEKALSGEYVLNLRTLDIKKL